LLRFGLPPAAAAAVAARRLVLAGPLLPLDLAHGFALPGFLVRLWSPLCHRSSCCSVRWNPRYVCFRLRWFCCVLTPPYITLAIPTPCQFTRLLPYLGVNFASSLCVWRALTLAHWLSTAASFLFCPAIVSSPVASLCFCLCSHMTRCRRLFSHSLLWDMHMLLLPIVWCLLYTLQETGITLSARNFLEGQNQTAKEYIVSLAVLVNSQGNIYSLKVEVNRQEIWVFPWRFSITSKEMTYFLECNCKQSRKLLFLWVLFLTAKKNTYFLGCYSKLSSKLSFSWGLLNFLGGWQPRKCCKYLTYILVTLAEKNNNILKVPKNPRIWHEIIIWLYYLAIKFSNRINKVGLYMIYKWIHLSHSYIAIWEMYLFVNSV
jgi:hypothetical protein